MRDSPFNSVPAVVTKGLLIESAVGTLVVLRHTFQIQALTAPTLSMPSKGGEPFNCSASTLVNPKFEMASKSSFQGPDLPHRLWGITVNRKSEVDVR